MSKECKALVANQADQGTFYDAGEAAKFLENFFTASGVQPDDPHAVYGFVFGLSKVRELIRLIDVHNSARPAPKDIINAIRVYRAGSERAPGAGMVEDVLLCPIAESGIDYPEPLALTGEKIILSGSGPCPNVCGKTMFFFNVI